MEDGKCSLCHQGDAILSCDCTSRPILMCAGCVGMHAIRPGRHAIVSYKAMPAVLHEGNLLCDVCRTSSADSICTCAAPLKKYCESCRTSHMSKSRFATHSVLPISAWESVKKRDYVSLIRDLAASNLAKSILNQNLRDIEECRERVRNAFASAIAELQSLEASLYQKLDAVHATAEKYVDTLCEELDNLTYGKIDSSKYHLVDSIRTMPETEIREELKLFRYSLESQQIVDIVRNWVKFEFNAKSDPPITALPLISGKSLLQFSFASRTFSSSNLNTSVAADYSTSFHLRDGYTLFCVGGVKSNSAYTVNLRNSEVQALPNMTSYRGFSGLCLVGDSLYAFGGHFQRFLKTAERLISGDQSWKAVADMNVARCGFNPVVRDSFVYLIGGQGAKGTIDVYDLSAHSVSTLQPRLPENWFTTSLLVDQSILILHSGSVFILDETNVLTEKSKGSYHTFRWSNINPLWWKDRVYYVFNSEAGPTELQCIDPPSTIPQKVTEIHF